MHMHFEDAFIFTHDNPNYVERWIADEWGWSRAAYTDPVINTVFSSRPVKR